MRRRVFLGAMGAGLAGLAGRSLAETALITLRPTARPALAGTSGEAAKAATDLIAAAKLGGRTAYALLDQATGAVVEAFDADTSLPPASTAKAITSLYALDALGTAHRFQTRLLATGPVSDGELQGDLILAGGGDPTLTTDDLADLAQTAASQGLRRIAGRFLVWGGALPYVREIDRDQPAWLGYNPAVAGLNLNFNRVNFTWKREGTDYLVGMNAEDRRFVPPVGMARMALSDRDLPVYTYAESEGREDWSVSRRALGGGGSRWLPVRHPDLYAGDVFRTLAVGAGISLPKPAVAARPPDGQTLAIHDSDPLPEVLREMMRYSTNITAEAVGMAASLRHGVASHARSGPSMSAWVGTQAGVPGMRFRDHSGLGGSSRVTPVAMATALARLGPKSGLQELMRLMTLEEDGQAFGGGLKVKTGTLNFASGLVGFLGAPSGRDFVFAIYSADVARRDRLTKAERERPDGGKAWVKRARKLQRDLIARWLKTYGV